MLGTMTVSLKLLADLIRHGYRLFYPSFKSVNVPLPSVAHKVITGENLVGKKLLFVGDVHGCLDEFKELLERCDYFSDQDDLMVICVGDVINKGPKSVETLRFVQNQPKIHMVRGNHENNCLRRLIALREHGIPLAPKAKWVKEFDCEDEEFLRELPYTITIPLINGVVVHAGLVPVVPVEEQSINNMVSMRNVNPETLHPSSKTEKGECWAKYWEGPQVVVFGHDARRGVQKFPFAYGLDGGCVYGKKLVGLLLDPSQGENVWQKSEILSVDAKEKYAPVEKEESM